MPVSYLRTLIFLFFFGHLCFAQKPPTFDIVQSSILYPHTLKPGYFKSEVALSQVKLPFDWLETSAQAPLFHYHAVIGLPKSFSIDSRFSTLFVANQLTLGPRWGKQFDRISFNTGFDVAYAFGFLNILGFDSSVSTWINYPNLSLGYKTKDIVFTLKAELSVVTSNSSRQGENEIVSDKNFFNGYTLGIYLEQRLWKNHIFILGFKNTYAKYHFMGWPAFSTFNRFYNIPEVYLGLVL
jgi:hypothetical protein